MSEYRICFYIFVRGDTLDAVARKYHLRSWKELWAAPCNVGLRHKRSKPELIQPGDRIGIPPDPRAVLESRLKTLQELRGKMDRYFSQLIAELDADFQKVSITKQGVDTAAMVAQMFVGLTNLVVAGFRSVTLTGEKLASFNNDLAKTWMRGRMEDVTGLIGSNVKVTGEEGLGWAVGKILLKSWSDMTSPSYWAGRYTGDPDEVYRQARSYLVTTRSGVLASIDKRIAKTRDLMGVNLTPA